MISDLSRSGAVFRRDLELLQESEIVSPEVSNVGDAVL
jgi:hypothetical protein